MPARLPSQQLTQAIGKAAAAVIYGTNFSPYSSRQLLTPTESKRQTGTGHSELLVLLTRLLLKRQLTQPAGIRQGNVCCHLCRKLYAFVRQGNICSHLCHKLRALHVHGRKRLASGAGQCLPSTLSLCPRQTASLWFKTSLGSHS